MVAASGIDAINRGDFDIVLGEMHLAIPTCRHYPRSFRGRPSLVTDRAGVCF
jgi:hypothetical protein